MVIAGLLLACLAQDLDVLIERLRSADVESRGKAELDLAARGPEALPALRKLEADPDLEVRGRARRAIDDILRRERVRAVRPAPVRLTLKLVEEPLASALEKVLAPFGFRIDDAPVRGDRQKDQRVSLDLRGAPLWEAVSALESAAKAEVEFGAWGVEVQNPNPKVRKPPVLDLGELRLMLVLDPERREDRGIEIRLVALLPPGGAPLGWEVDRPRLVDEQGREIPIQPDPFGEARRRPDLRKEPGLLTRAAPWRGYVKPDLLLAAGSLRFQGSFVTTYPRDLLRHEFDLRGAEGPVSREVHGLKCSFQVRKNPDREAYSIEDSFEPLVAGPKRFYLVWTEDEQGRWLEDRMSGMLGGAPGGRSGGSGGLRAKPAKVVMAEFVGEDRMTLPFDFKDVRLRPSK